MESNVMAGRSLLLHFTFEHQPYMVCMLLLEKVMTGSTKSAAGRAYRRIAPKTVEVALLPSTVAKATYSRLLEAQQDSTPGLEYFDVDTHWTPPIAANPWLSITVDRLFCLGDSKSRQELAVFATINQSRLPLAMGICLEGIPSVPMERNRRTLMIDALGKLALRFVTPPTSRTDPVDNPYIMQKLMDPALHKDGHILCKQLLYC